MSNSDSHHAGRIRLVRIVEHLSDSDRRHQALDLAAQGLAKLYVSVPPGRTVYTESFGVGPQHASFSNRSYQRTKMLLEAGRSVNDGGAAIFYPVADPDICFLALKPSHAARLRAAGNVDVHWFPSGLKIDASAQRQSDGWLVPYAFLSHFCLRPVGQAGTLDSPFGPEGSPLEHTLRIGLADLYIDQSIADALHNEPGASLDVDDPYRLKENAKGVYVLYAAAKHFYGSSQSPKASRETVMDWLQSRGGGKLYNDTVSKQLAKLIDPDYRRGSGVQVKDQKSFDEKLVQSAEFIAAYKRSDFITLPLALILYIAEWWIGEKQKLRGTSAKPPRAALARKLEGVGFYGKEELEAIQRVVMWPEK